MHDCKKSDILTVTTTVDSMDAARKLARGIVESRLAACVQIDAIAASVYRWEGAICEEPELRLTIKTLPQMLAQLEAYIARHHPYDLPQLTAWPTMCSAAYAQWVAESMKPTL
jgi:periplasmic divalent cation tolerance protein